MKRVSVKTIGCKTNFADTRVLETSLEKLGFELVPYGDISDLVIVNSCVVTQRAEADSRRALTKGKRSGGNPGTVLTGCGVFKNGKSSLAEFADLVLPMEHQGSEENLTALFAGLSGRKDIKGYGRKSLSRVNRSRVFVKIQNGCDNRCSYCIVPSVRGISVSRHHDDVLREIRAYEDQGFPEVVLTGNHIGSYGKDMPGLPPLSKLVEMALKETGRLRIRLSSIEVDEVDAHLLEMVTGEKRLCNHLHIPLQSGDDLILKRMRRWYSTRDYRRFADMVKGRSEEICLGTDIITGFPGESDDSFERTYRFFSTLPVNYAHVFSYSRRDGTEAAKMVDQVPERTKKLRTSRLREEGEEKRHKFIERFIGRDLEVIAEKVSAKSKICQGTSDNYIKVEWKGESFDRTLPVNVRITGRNGDRAVGTRR